MENKELKKAAVGRKKGLVVSDSADKTVIVEVVRFETHPKYLKKFRVTKRYKAHDDANKNKIGDRVEIESCRPISGQKRYKVV